MGLPYLALELPERFALEVLTPDGRWFEEAIYSAGEFSRLDDGSYVCQRGGTGTPLYLRCLRKDGSTIEVVDGHGEQHTYRLDPVDSKRESALPKRS